MFDIDTNCGVAVETPNSSAAATLPSGEPEAIPANRSLFITRFQRTRCTGCGY